MASNNASKSTAATTFSQNLQGGARGVNAPGSLKGGTAATNVTASPRATIPAGGINQKNAAIRRGNAYSVETRVSTGASTNDKAK